MNDIFELIMGNMFIVIIIIGALIKLFSNSKAKENERTNNEQQSNEDHEESQSVFQQVKAEMEQQKKAQTLENERRSKEVAAEKMKQVTQSVGSVSVEKHRQAQVDRLKQGYQTASKAVDSEHSSGLSSLEPLRQETTGNDEISLKLNKRLTQKGLIESVVMAEVLGSPRALKPYRSVTSNRHR